MQIGVIKKSARLSLKNKWGIAILIAFIGFGLSNFLPTVIEIVFSGGFSNWLNNESTFITSLSTIISIIITPLMIGTYWVFLDLVRGKNVRIEDLFTLFSNLKLYGKTLGLTILTSILLLLWSLLLIIPGIIKTLSYSQVYYIFKDHPEYSINEIITESRKLMNGYKWKYFLLNLSFIGWGLLSILTVFIGFLWLIPYMNTSYATFYQQLTSEKASS